MARRTRNSKAQFGVQWYLPGGRKPIAYSHAATSHLIGALAEQGLTFAQAHTECRYDPDGRTVLQAFIDRGHADTLMSSIGVR